MIKLEIENQDEICFQDAQIMDLCPGVNMYCLKNEPKTRGEVGVFKPDNTRLRVF